MVRAYLCVKIAATVAAAAAAVALSSLMPQFIGHSLRDLFEMLAMFVLISASARRVAACTHLHIPPGPRSIGRAVRAHVCF